METTTSAPAKISNFDIFESVVCSRCFGNPDAFRVFGHVASGKCLKCMGALRHFTKRGAADHAKWRVAIDAIVVKPVAELKAGDFVQLRGMKKYVEVASVSEPRFYGRGSTNGVEHENFSVTVTLVKQVWQDTGCALGSYKTSEFDVFTDETVRIHPGIGFEFPKAEEFVSKPRKAKSVAA